MTTSDLTVELIYLRRQWKNAKGDEDPTSFQDIVHMVQDSFEETTPLRHWEAHAKNVLKLLRLIIVAAGTSAFAERTFSLARHVKTWLRAGMDDETFDNLGVLAWYSEEVDAIIDTIKIGNAYIGNKPGRKKIMVQNSQKMIFVLCKNNT